MAILLKFQNVSLFKMSSYGIDQLTFDIERGKRYWFRVSNEEQLKTLDGLIEGRYKKESGYIERSKKLFIQSDRQLLGERVYSQTAGEWLSVKNDFFQFGERRRSKFGFIEQLKARYLLDLPVYKLDDIGRIKFALLALAFQERGMTLISELLTMDLSDLFRQFLHRIIRQTHTTCCLLTSSNEVVASYQEDLPEMIQVTVG